MPAKFERESCPKAKHTFHVPPRIAAVAGPHTTIRERRLPNTGTTSIVSKHGRAPNKSHCLPICRFASRSALVPSLSLNGETRAIATYAAPRRTTSLNILDENATFQPRQADTIHTAHAGRTTRRQSQRARVYTARTYTRSNNKQVFTLRGITLFWLYESACVHTEGLPRQDCVRSAEGLATAITRSREAERTGPRWLHGLEARASNTTAIRFLFWSHGHFAWRRAQDQSRSRRRKRGKRGRLRRVQANLVSMKAASLERATAPLVEMYIRKSRDLRKPRVPTIRAARNAGRDQQRGERDA